MSSNLIAEIPHTVVNYLEAIAEAEKRIHEIRFHGRKGNPDSLEKSVEIGYESLRQMLEAGPEIQDRWFKSFPVRIIGTCIVSTLAAFGICHLFGL